MRFDDVAKMNALALLVRPGVRILFCYWCIVAIKLADEKSFSGDVTTGIYELLDDVYGFAAMHIAEFVTSVLLALFVLPLVGVSNTGLSPFGPTI